MIRRMIPNVLGGGLVGLMLMAITANVSAQDTEQAAQALETEALTTLREARQTAEARDRQRLTDLVEDSDALDAALTQAQAELSEQQQRREVLEARRQELKSALDELNAQRNAEGSDLDGVFSTVVGESGELRDELGHSWLTLGQEGALPARLDNDDILTVQQIESVADSLMQLTTATARVERLEAPVAGSDGVVEQQTVIRVGDMLAFSQGKLLERVGEDGQLAVIDHTPSEVSKTLTDFADGNGVVVPVDPADGRVLEALGQQPTLWERFQQGGAVGWVIVALGAVGLLIAVIQYFYLARVSITLRRQMANIDELRNDNPLGRVLQRFNALGEGHVPEALEARLDEAMLAEQPRIERGQALVKMVAAVAPLLGLLGTVTGMIVTFQSITVFGTGDPQLMAGGISQALVTTVLGLIVAVPLLFAHTALSSRSRSLIGTMEGRASAVLADRLEQDRLARQNRETAGNASHDALA
ncbi:MotA/TolQ/ExbB proton channel family protein [Halomonas huangheensis]|uniref:MotA/TolQ/ExbB proton channel domain-containing protein n=1 Tax=Halomonas huangheensis TaxID=1178482 RepID=W1N1N9_9GAMM|nr:MotA/TolQ/ExbB proton channel family protein [Halomonas huangheensis]ALM52187.1 flagellar motor protein MotA [Halomonas huangheensis]ERL49404.1 hypothetical protein BJB45_06390 [Halomonas huangheensis]